MIFFTENSDVGDTFAPREFKELPNVSVAALKSNNVKNKRGRELLLQLQEFYKSTLANEISIGYLFFVLDDMVYYGGSNAKHQSSFYCDKTGTNRIPQHIYRLHAYFNNKQYSCQSSLYENLAKLIQLDQYPSNFKIILIKDIGIPHVIFEACIWEALKYRSDGVSIRKNLLNTFAEIIPKEVLDILWSSEHERDLGAYFLECIETAIVEIDILNRGTEQRTMARTNKEKQSNEHLKNAKTKFCLACYQNGKRKELHNEDRINRHYIENIDYRSK